MAVCQGICWPFVASCVRRRGAGEDLVERQAGLTDHFCQRGRIGAVRPLPVGGDDVGSRGEGHQEAGRRFHEREALGHRLAGGAEGIVARHVGDDHPRLSRAALEGANEVGDAETFDRHVHVALDPGIDGEQVVLAFELHAMAGQIDRHRRAGLEILDLVEEVAHEAAQIAGAKIAALDHLETGARQGLRDEARVVHGGRKRARPIGALPDHEGEPVLRGGGGRLTENGRQDEGGKNDNTFQERHGAPRICPALRDDGDRKGQDG